jgi:hypothetical protein
MDQHTDMRQSLLRAHILALATRLARSEAEALAWFHDECILRCGQMTAAELLAIGQGEQALQFLLDIVESETGGNDADARRTRHHAL